MVVPTAINSYGFLSAGPTWDIMSVNEEGFVNIARLLVLPLLFSACLASVAAQSSLERNPVSSQPLTTLPQNAQPGIHADQIIPPLEFRRPVLPPGLQPPFHLDRISPPQKILRYVQLPADEQSDSACYSIRSYRVTRDDPESDSTRLVGYSTCQPAARFQLKDARDSPVQGAR